MLYPTLHQPVKRAICPLQIERCYTVVLVQLLFREEFFTFFSESLLDATLLSQSPLNTLHKDIIQQYERSTMRNDDNILLGGARVVYIPATTYYHQGLA